jgi:hypothetical protein
LSKGLSLSKDSACPGNPRPTSKRPAHWLASGQSINQPIGQSIVGVGVGAGHRISGMAV